MTADHDHRDPVRSQTAYRAKPSLVSPVIALDPIVHILRGIGEKVVNRAQQRHSQIRGDLQRSFATGQQCFEEPGRRFDVASPRHLRIEDLAVLVYGPVHVPPNTGDPDVGLIDNLLPHRA